MNQRIILVVDITIYLPSATTIKQKRNLKRSIIDRLSKKYRLSIAEVSNQDSIKRLDMSVAYVSISMSPATLMLSKLFDELSVMSEKFEGELSFDYEYYSKE